MRLFYSDPRLITEMPHLAALRATHRARMQSSVLMKAAYFARLIVASVA